MDKFTPYDKLSKKEQKRLDSIKRRNWGGLNPVTRTTPDKKKYSRKDKHKNGYEEEI
jgi:hypothetical protein